MRQFSGLAWIAPSSRTNNSFYRTLASSSSWWSSSVWNSVWNMWTNTAVRGREVLSLKQKIVICRTLTLIIPTCFFALTQQKSTKRKWDLKSCPPNVSETCNTNDNIWSVKQQGTPTQWTLKVLVSISKQVPSRSSLSCVVTASSALQSKQRSKAPWSCTCWCSEECL